MHELTGIAAGTTGVLMALSPLLQARRVRIIGDSTEVSVALYVVMVINAIAWSAHGIVVGDPVIVVPNVTGLLVATTSLVVICRYRSRDDVSIRA